jgi:cysteine synthase
MKDRMALAMLEAAEADGRLQPGGSVAIAVHTGMKYPSAANYSRP